VNWIGEKVLENFAEQEDVERAVLVRKLVVFYIKAFVCIEDHLAGLANGNPLNSLAFRPAEKIGEMQLDISKFIEKRGCEIWIRS